MRKYIIIVVFTIAGLLGCSSSDRCKNDSDCPKDNKCINEKCYPNSFTPDPQVIDPNTGCNKDEECGTCRRCDEGVCRPIKGCDAGIVILDAGRDIVKVDTLDIEDADLDVEADADIIEDADVPGTDVEDVIDRDIVEDIEPSDVDAGTDITDISNCDAYGTLVVTRRIPSTDIPRGTILTIYGQGFDSECGTLSVKFDGDSREARIVDISSSSIQVVVPGFAKDGNITVNSFGQTAKNLSYKIMRRLFFSDYGSDSSPANQFFVLTYPNFLDYRGGKFTAEGNFPVQILLDPYNLLVLVITRGESDYGYVISAYDFATLSFIKKVSNPTQNAFITSAVMDYEKSRIYLVSSNGHLYIHEMESLVMIDDIPVGVELYGIDIDKVNNRLFLCGRYDTALPPPSPPPNNYRGALFVRDRDTFKPVGDGYTLFGDEKTLARDIKYHPSTNSVFTVDYFAGNLYVFNVDNLNQEKSPISLGANSGPMKMTFGKDHQRLYVACNNSPSTPVDATATIRGFDINSLTEIAGSPFDTRLITSTASDNTKNLVNIFYDDYSGYLIAVSNADNRIAVIMESTFSFISLSPDNTKTASSSGNFAISVEDW
ncbi:MAG: IPT/TIG domain-containing protein [Myxococcota bacterium]